MNTFSRRWWGALGLVAVCAVAAFGKWHRATVLQLAESRRAAVASMSRLERAAAEHWEPEAYAEVQTILHDAYVADRAWRVLPLRVQQARAAHAGYTALVERAAGLEVRTRAAEEVAVGVSATMVDQAHRAIDAASPAALSVTLSGARRLTYQQARLALYEARAYHDQRDYVSAADRARQAIALAGGVRAHAASLLARFDDPRLLDRWRGWQRELIEWSRREGKPALLVDKAQHRLYLYEHGREKTVLAADMGFNWVADKRHAGDGATPEGRYRVVNRKGRGASQFYKAFLLDYPNALDRQEFERARRTGAVPVGAGIGGLIEIHGEGGRGRDWTRGCVAISNHDMDEIFARIELGTPVVIVGSLGGNQSADASSRERAAAAHGGGV